MNTQPNPFRFEASNPRYWILRVFAGPNLEAVVKAVGNLLASRPPSGISRTELLDTFKEHGVREKDLDALLTRIYKHALGAFLLDNALSVDELSYLNDLATLLALDQEHRTASLRALAGPTYRAAVDAAIANRVLTDESMETLRSLGKTLGMDISLQDSIRGEAVRPIVEEAMRETLSTHRYTPEQEAAVEKLAVDLKASISFADPDKIERFKTLAKIDRGEFPQVSCTVALQKGEYCHFYTEAKWAEVRTLTKRVNYSGLSTSFRIMKGVRYRSGSFTPQRITKDVLTTLDDGELFITSKRLIFRGGKSNKVITYASILGFELYSDGIKVEKSSGKPPYLLFSGDNEMAAAILSAKLAGT